MVPGRKVMGGTRPRGGNPDDYGIAGLDSDHFECTVEPGYAGPCERFAANNERIKRQNWRPSPPAPRARPGRRPRLGGKKNKRRRKRLGGRKSYNRTASRYVVGLTLWCTFSRQDRQPERVGCGLDRYRPHAGALTMIPYLADKGELSVGQTAPVNYLSPPSWEKSMTRCSSQREV